VDRFVRKNPDKCSVVVESSEDTHKEIIESTIAKRAYRKFEKRGRKHGYDLEDWLIAEKELLRDDFDGNTSEFHFLFECPRDPDVITILSLTIRSLVVFQGHSPLFEEAKDRLDVLSVHLLPEEIDPSHAVVKAADGLFLVYLPKKNS
jgi:hypothetical protein